MADSFYGLVNIVGRQYPGLGEKFNDYKDNKAIGEYSAVFGKNNIAKGNYTFVGGESNIAYGEGSTSFGSATFAGSKCFKITGINIAKNSITLENAEGISEVLEQEKTNKNELRFCIQITAPFLDLGKIENISGNTITVTGLNKIVEIYKQSQEQLDKFIENTNNTSILWLPKFPYLGDNNIIGDYSLAIGLNNVASQRGSVALGQENLVFGRYGFAAGRGNKTGLVGSAVGLNNEALGYGASAFGENLMALGKYSNAIGYSTNKITSDLYNLSELGLINKWKNNEIKFNLAYGVQSSTSGNDCLALGAQSRAIGLQSIAMGAGSVAAGHYTEAYGLHSYAFGLRSKAGANGFKLSAALVENSNEIKIVGNVDSTMIGKYVSIYYGKIYHLYSTISEVGEGFIKITKSISSEIIKSHNWVANDNSCIFFPTHPYMGNGTTNLGTCSFVFGNGNMAFGSGSFSAGTENSSTGNNSVVFGYRNTAIGNNQFVLGQYNKLDQDALLLIGNGTDYSNRKNIFTVKDNGITEIGYNMASNYAEFLNTIGKVELTSKDIEVTNYNPVSLLGDTVVLKEAFQNIPQFTPISIIIILNKEISIENEWIGISYNDWEVLDENNYSIVHDNPKSNAIFKNNQIILNFDNNTGYNGFNNIKTIKVPYRGHLNENYNYRNGGEIIGIEIISDRSQIWPSVQHLATTEWVQAYLTDIFSISLPQIGINLNTIATIAKGSYLAWNGNTSIDAEEYNKDYIYYDKFGNSKMGNITIPIGFKGIKAYMPNPDDANEYWNKGILNTEYGGTGLALITSNNKLEAQSSKDFITKFRLNEMQSFDFNVKTINIIDSLSTNNATISNKLTCKDLNFSQDTDLKGIRSNLGIRKVLFNNTDTEVKFNSGKSDKHDKKTSWYWCDNQYMPSGNNGLNGDPKWHQNPQTKSWTWVKSDEIRFKRTTNIPGLKRDFQNYSIYEVQFYNLNQTCLLVKTSTKAGTTDDKIILRGIGGGFMYDTKETNLSKQKGKPIITCVSIIIDKESNPNNPPVILQDAGYYYVNNPSKFYHKPISYIYGIA